MISMMIMRFIMTTNSTLQGLIGMKSDWYRLWYVSQKTLSVSADRSTLLLAFSVCMGVDHERLDGVEWIIVFGLKAATEQHLAPVEGDIDPQ
jgi:hypothetical protein